MPLNPREVTFVLRDQSDALLTTGRGEKKVPKERRWEIGRSEAILRGQIGQDSPSLLERPNRRGKDSPPPIKRLDHTCVATGLLGCSGTRAQLEQDDRAQIRERE